MGKQSQLCAMPPISVAGPSKLGRQYYQWPAGSKCGLEGNKASSVACMGALRQIGGAISWWASPKDSTPTIVKSKTSELMASRQIVMLWPWGRAGRERACHSHHRRTLSYESPMTI